MTYYIHYDILYKLCFNYRQVHISQETYEAVKSIYKVAPGRGETRNSYLAEKRIKTYLITSRRQGCEPDYDVSLFE